MSHWKFLLLATLFQGGLLLAGFGIAVAAGVNLVFEVNSTAYFLGVLATLPMFGVFWYAMQSTWSPLQELRRILIGQLGPLIAPCSIPALIYVSLLAGFSEEILFRGAIQNGLLDRGWELALAVIATNVLFGLCHAATRMYFGYAAVAGLYLSWVAGFSNQNLAPAIVAHSLYDFVALWIIRQRVRRHSDDVNGDSPDPSVPDVESSPSNA
ncbi:MAG: CPBP family intramembrane metalloprotease [Planctomycetaceae bacterium]|nr:CPBP family intramembrane metalloprotease [Planctomycetaceae bacterium]